MDEVKVERWVFCRHEDWVGRYGPFTTEEDAVKCLLILAGRTDTYGVEIRWCDGAVPALPGKAV